MPPTPEPHHHRTDRDRGLSRRSIVRTGAWTAPVVAVAVAVPSFAASLGAITGTQRLTRTPPQVSSAGTVTNSTTADHTVALTWMWTADASGPGMGTFSGAGVSLGGWTDAGTGFEGSRLFRVNATRVVAAGTTVGFPQVTMTTSSATVSGDVTAHLLAPAGIPVVQPTALRFPGSTPSRQGARSPRPTEGADVTTFTP